MNDINDRNGRSVPDDRNEKTIAGYVERYGRYGRDPRTLGWDKGKQAIRFDILTSRYCFDNKSVLDAGCGFGEALETLVSKASGFKYTGVDLVGEFLDEARAAYPDAAFIKGDFLSLNFDEPFDYCVASGVFNEKSETGELEFIKRCMRKAYDITRDGFAFNFLSDKVDYRLEHANHSNPAKILDLAYAFSRNIALRNDYMPFEYTLFVFKDDSFDKEDTLFRRYKAANPNLARAGGFYK